MAKTRDGRRRILPFRIPFFRVFYSLTYTALYILTLVFLLITPVTMAWTTIQQEAIQYTIMIGGAYVLTAIIAIFIYSSRLYTNRSVLSAVGKAYVPIEDGEVGKIIRKMIVKQLHRSAIVAWEARPRDLYGEILRAEQEGILPQASESVDREDYTVGSQILIDPARPPWGDIQHPGWTSPNHTNDNKNPHVRFHEVITELPNLIEARAVSLAPSDPNMTPVQGEPPAADPLVINILTRPANMAMREYVTQLGYLGLIGPEIGQEFIQRYEKARFGGVPANFADFNHLMSIFAILLSGMTHLDPAIIDEIRKQTEDQHSILDVPILALPSGDGRRSVSPSMMSPVTAREAQSSPFATPYLSTYGDSAESLGSVIRRSSINLQTPTRQPGNTSPLYNIQAPSSSTLPSDAGSVIIHDVHSAG